MDRICLIFSGKMLLDEEMLEMHDIADGSTVFLVAKPLQQVVHVLWVIAVIITTIVEIINNK